jgi:hypothetical protein
MQNAVMMCNTLKAAGGNWHHPKMMRELILHPSGSSRRRWLRFGCLGQ